MSGIRVSFSGDLEAALAAAADRCESIAGAAVRDVGHELVLAAQTLAGTGPYGQSFTVVPDGTTAAEAGSTSPMAAILEKGRGPGRRPSPNALQAAFGGSHAAAVRAADRIAARGTKGKRTVKKASYQIRDDGTLERITGNALAAMAELGKG